VSTIGSTRGLARLVLGFALLAVLPLTPTLAEDAGEPSGGLPGEIAAEVGLVSDYVDRGISNSDGNPAVQGGISYSIGTGVGDTSAYAGFWGSSVDFDDGGEATVELDWYFGLNGTAPGTELVWDASFAYYSYPGASSGLNYDYWEIPVVLSHPLWEAVTVTGGYYFSPEYFGDAGHAHYLNGGVGWEIPVEPVTVTLEAATGHQWIEDNAWAGVEDYQDWSVGVSVGYEAITVGLGYTDTNLSKSECFGGTKVCDPRLVLRVGAAL
jgi:uncharacterized protein (TIGR02001 family)